MVGLFFSVGCNNQRPEVHEQKPPARREFAERDATGSFDYYVLALSWSPEFCHSHPDAAECAKHLGFVLHGLWPQNENGYPENCSTAPGPRDPGAMTDIFPDAGLVMHEWKTHGTCSGLDPDAYFQLVRRADAALKIPEQFQNPQRGFSITPRDLKEQLVAANPQLQNEEIAVSCGNNWLTGISICMDKRLQPRACGALRDCRANVIRVAPTK